MECDHCREMRMLKERVERLEIRLRYPPPSSMTTDVTHENVLTVVGQYFNVMRSELLGKERHANLALARCFVMYLLRYATSPRWSYPEIGRALGNRDHTTAISAVRRIETLRSTKPEIEHHYLALRRLLGLADP